MMTDKSVEEFCSYPSVKCVQTHAGGAVRHTDKHSRDASLLPSSSASYHCFEAILVDLGSNEASESVQGVHRVENVPSRNANTDW